MSGVHEDHELHPGSGSDPNILNDLGLWVAKPGVPPKTNVEHPPWRAPPKELKIDYSDSQAASCGEYPYTDSDYFIDTYLC
jgi:hypothetical protein